MSYASPKVRPRFVASLLGSQLLAMAVQDRDQGAFGVFCDYLQDFPQPELPLITQPSSRVPRWLWLRLKDWMFSPEDESGEGWSMIAQLCLTHDLAPLGPSLMGRARILGESLWYTRTNRRDLGLALAMFANLLRCGFYAEHRETRRPYLFGLIDRACDAPTLYQAAGVPESSANNADALDDEPER